MNDSLKIEIKDLLNQIAIKLENVEMPEVDNDYDYWDGNGAASIPVAFKGQYTSDVSDLDLRSIKAVVGAILTDLENNRTKYTEAEKMARAYYSSFCNG